MDYEVFKGKLIKKMKNLAAKETETCSIKVEKRYKVNQMLDALTFAPNEVGGKVRCYPVFYLQELYELYRAGNSLNRIGRYVISMLNAVPSEEVIEKGTFDKESMKEHVILQLIHYERNIHLLEDIPHRRFLDLAVIYRSVIQYDKDQWSSMIVTNATMEEWGMTEAELYEMAWTKTAERFPFVLKDTGRIFGSGIVVENGLGRMHFLTTELYQFGAAAMLYPDILKLAAKGYGSGYAILPGSLHELYLVKDTPEDAKAWKEVVECANSELVPDSEWLSDSIYYYDYENETITILL